MKVTLNIAVLISAAIAVALLADAWRSARHDSQQLATTLAAQNALIQQASDRENQRDSQVATALAAIQTQKRSIQTPQQASQQLASVLPPLPLPVSVHIPDLTTPLQPGESPETIVSIPQPDLVPLYDQLQDCREDKLQNDALQKDLADEKSKSTSLQHERDAAITVAHGGGFLKRVKQAAKWFVIGVATGAAVAALAHH